METPVTTVGDIVAAVDRLAPFGLAESWDNVGLLLGDESAKVKRVLVALDVGDEVLAEAERVKAECVVAHHPLIFKSVDRLTGATRQGRLALRLVGGGRSLVAAHTNLDGAPGGLCDILADWLGLVDTRPLSPAKRERPYKVVVFVPASSLGAVQAAAFEAGAGRIGAYTECSFAVRGEGTFLPGAGAAPSAGEAGRRNTVSEARLEVVTDAGHLGDVMAAVRGAHPYETPAVDAYALAPPAAGGGVGRVGRLEQPKSLGELADAVKGALGLTVAGVAGDASARVDRVGVVTGNGGGFADAAAGCDAYVTGELKLSEVQDLVAAGVGVVLGGHYETERIPLEAWAPRLAETAGVDVRLSEGERGMIAAR